MTTNNESEIAPFNPSSVLNEMRDKPWHTPLKYIGSEMQDEAKKDLCQLKYYYCDEQLEKSITVIVAAMRWHAMLFQNRVKVQETYDRESPISAKIKSIHRSWPENDSRYGVSYLCYLPDYGKWCVWHPNTAIPRMASIPFIIMNTPIDQREAPSNLPFTTVFTFGHQTLGKHDTNVTKYTPFEGDINPKMAPKEEDIAKEVKKFLDVAVKDNVSEQSSDTETDR